MKDMSYISYERTCCTEDMYYGRTCLKGGCVLREDISYMKTCLTG